MNNFGLTDEAYGEWQRLLDPRPYLAGADKSFKDQFIKFLSTDYSDANQKDFKQIDLKNFIKQVSYLLGVNITSIKFVSDSNSKTLGGFNQSSNSLVVNICPENLSEENKIMFFNTIIHELRHAQQYQKFAYFNDDSELSTKIRENIKNYKRPSDKHIKNAKYYLNFIEVDAERFAMGFTKELLNELHTDVNYLDHTRLLSRANEQNKECEEELEKQLQLSAKMVEVDDESFLYLKKAIEEYKRLVFIDKSKDQKSIEDLRGLILSMSRMYLDKRMSNYVELDGNKKEELVCALYDGVDTLEIAKKLDDPVIEMLGAIEHKYGRSFYYSHRPLRIKEIANRCQIMLSRYGIDYDADNPADVLERAMQIMPEVFLNHVQNYKNTDKMKEEVMLLYDLSGLMEVKNANNKEFPKTDETFIYACSKNIEKVMPRAELQKALEKIVSDENYPVAFSTLINHTLNRYGYHYKWAKMCKDDYGHFGIHEFCAKTMGAKYNPESFADIFDKCENTLPKFLMNCLLKEKLTEDELQVIQSLTRDNGLIAIPVEDIENGMQETLKKTFMAKTKLDRAMKSKEKHKELFELFESRGINLDNVLTASQKVKTQE